MRSAEESDALMDELKEVVQQSLEKKGVLAKIRAELRANVFEALDEQGIKQGNGLASQQTTKFQKLQASEDGRRVTHLVQEFLEWAGLEYTLKVFTAEAAGGEEVYPGRKGLENALGYSGADETPLLQAVMEGQVQVADLPSPLPQARPGAAARLRAQAASPSSSEESPSPDIFARARRRSQPPPREEPEPQEMPSTKSSNPSPNNSMDSIGSAALKLDALPGLKGGKLGGLEPLGPAGGQLPSLRLGALAPLDGPKTSLKSPSEKSDTSVLNRSQDLNRSLELGASVDFSDQGYSGEFDRDIEEVIEEEELELDLPEDDARSEDSYTYEEQPSSQSIAGRNVSMDMMASGLSASDRSGELDLEDSADLIESAEMMLRGD
mmetsp:Transcript_14461/g.27789  ORF Transcript_14461/g.27789 Transcript_14461/m.27789 type:complete len:380 (-) Transcript_14461:42-1181(-)|eukprot:CAMPEP_0114229268 /NCGR_PEP_ID=MMETSP0058-20121206/2812_1 /TAXON_ID=36894 /ORGANISM="Pyramimonas parkeae, CCMP726" /LENGTH=379 /DNA_ID=CAMNT_0001340323 /DNA_START=51 /DNA_END=1190 /DNA_ORIENTATION=+